ncbi:MAG: hypothetical protein JWO94_3684, partial [Verrucomicrobiaceae bacterium]|nr:hypothetical protein [Verrucomicrobiaceae bacterium]
MKTDEADSTNQMVASLLEKAEASAPADQEQLKSAAHALSDHLKWELVQDWPDLFNLHRKPDGTMVAEPDTVLGERLRRLKQGVLPREHLLDATMQAFEAILGFSTLPAEGDPSVSEIPQPKGSTGGVSNAIEIHRAAMLLYNKTVGLRLLGKTLQETLGPRIKALFEGSSKVQTAVAKQLKKDLSKAIDAFAQHQSTDPLAQGKRLRARKTMEAKRIAIQAIEAARQLVEEQHRLPTKLAVRGRLERMLPKTSETSTSTWN